MRLTCPACSAAYEIDAGAIGERGRKVRCAACEKEWFQGADGAAPRSSAAASDPAAQSFTGGRIGRTDTLREDKPVLEDVQYAFTPDPAHGDDDDAALAASATFADETRADNAARAGDLANSLRDDDEGGRRGGAFIAGFITVALIALILIGAYVKAPEIAEWAPVTRAPLATYTDLVDQGRMMLAEAVGE